MPEIIACPDCGRQLRVPDTLLGRKVKCPGCGVNFTAGVAASEPPPAPKSVAAAPRAARRPALRNEEDEPPRRRRRDEEDDEPPRRRRRAEEDDELPTRHDEDEFAEDDFADSPRPLRDAWKKVRLGLTWVIISIWVYLGSIGVSIIGGMASRSRTVSGVVSTTGSGFFGLVLIVGLIGLVFLGFKVTGHGFGMAVPPKRNNSARGLGIATFILAAAGAALTLVGNILTMVEGVEIMTSGYSPNALFANSATGRTGILAGLTLLAAHIVYLFYLRSICFAVRKDGLASTVTTFMIAVGSLILACILIFVVMMFMMGASMDMAMRGNTVSGANTVWGTALIGGALMCVAGLIGLGLFVWYIVILHQIRAAVDTFRRKL